MEEAPTQLRGELRHRPAHSRFEVVGIEVRSGLASQATRRGRRRSPRVAAAASEPMELVAKPANFMRGKVRLPRQLHELVVKAPGLDGGAMLVLAHLIPQEDCSLIVPRDRYEYLRGCVKDAHIKFDRPCGEGVPDGLDDMMRLDANLIRRGPSRTHRAQPLQCLCTPEEFLPAATKRRQREGDENRKAAGKTSVTKAPSLVRRWEHKMIPEVFQQSVRRATNEHRKNPPVENCLEAALEGFIAERLVHAGTIRWRMVHDKTSQADSSDQTHIHRYVAALRTQFRAEEVWIKDVFQQHCQQPEC
mmetsp:Transcript_81780/g.227685  ORF Transcript_81780/g.227685 Transcript_81780/m.227685 type:complete len:304 (+) Transcript_81780:1016-1927(+)